MTNEMPADSEKKRENFEQALKACTRAVSGDAALDVIFSSEKPGLHHGKVVLPPLPVRATQKTVRELRGLADSAALRHKYHDTTLHNRLSPTSPKGKAVFDAMEEARYEAFGYKARGTRKNLSAFAESRTLKTYSDPAVKDLESRLAPLMAILVREKLTGQTIPKSLLAPIGDDLAVIDQKIGSLLHGLKDQSITQSQLAILSRTVITDLLGEDPFDDQKGDQQSPDEDIGDDPPEDEVEDGADDTALSQIQEEGQTEAGTSDEAIEDPDRQKEDTDSELENDEQSSEIGTETCGGSGPEGERDAHSGMMQQSNLPLDSLYGIASYTAFTEEYDEIIRAEDLCEAEELDRLRQYLDQQMAPLSGAVAKLANRLQRRLMAQHRRHWQFDLDDGLLDAGRLARVIANPLQSLSYKMESETEFKDTVVTLLLDNSGSMRGRPISTAAISADILARTLERCGVKVEILGFTTKAWKGGQARQKWLKEDRPQDPGRLNDLRHIIYKTADIPWRRTRRNLGLMMREGLLKENIDGEALLWAHQRLINRPEDRRILMIISDGAPVDDSSLSANSGTYLETHLRQVIHWIETKSPIELLAIGIGHDVTRYYKRAVTLTDVAELAGAIIDQLADLFEAGPNRDKTRRHPR